MKTFRVTFEVFKNDGSKEYRPVVVEAGTKKLAAVRAMIEINKIEGYSILYKNVHAIAEVT